MVKLYENKSCNIPCQIQLKSSLKEWFFFLTEERFFFWKMYKAKRTAAQKVRRCLGKYELGRAIGQGTFAKVRFAKNMETGDHVAIKILDKAKVQKHRLVEQVIFRVR